MNIHEYQAKQILKQNGIDVLMGQVAKSPQEAESVARRVGGKEWVVKAQIRASGRGKAGGVKLAKSLSDIKEHTSKLIGSRLVTSQTGPDGQEVQSVLIEESCQIEAQYYICLTIDKSLGHIVFLASSDGGVDLDATIESHPEKIMKISIPISGGYFPFIGRKIAYSIGMKGDIVAKAIDLFEMLFQIFVEYDCTMIEINPLAQSTEGKLYPLDVKIEFDDCALWRQEELNAYKDIDSVECCDRYHEGFSYIKLEGDIGCMANGAGLSMATLDVVKLLGGRPANFLEINGKADPETIENAFLLLLEDERLNGIFINIFGGLVKCDVLAQGLINATKKIPPLIPIVIRLEGTNVALGKKILKESGVKLEWSDNLEEGAKKLLDLISNKDEG